MEFDLIKERFIKVSALEFEEFAPGAGAAFARKAELDFDRALELVRELRNAKNMDAVARRAAHAMLLQALGLEAPQRAETTSLTSRTTDEMPQPQGTTKAWTLAKVLSAATDFAKSRSLPTGLDRKVLQFAVLDLCKREAQKGETVDQSMGRLMYENDAELNQLLTLDYVLGCQG